MLRRDDGNWTKDSGDGACGQEEQEVLRILMDVLFLYEDRKVFSCDNIAVFKGTSLQNSIV